VAKRVIRVHWLSGLVTDVDPGVETFASLTFENLGRDIFRCDTDASWRAALIRFEGQRLFINGSARR